MKRNIFSDYKEGDTMFVSSFGISLEGDQAFWGPGRRDEGIIHYVLRGKGVFNGQPVAENQGFYIPPNSLCEYYPDPDEPWSYFWMDCSRDMAERYLVSALNPDRNGIFNYDYRGKLQGKIDKIFSGGVSISAVEALGHAFSILALHHPRKDTAGPQQHVRRARNMIESNINKKLTVRQVADAIGINDRYLYLLFMQHEGISPKEYILQRKIETASDLLEHTDLSVMEIAAAVGFSDVYSFSRLYKTKQGISPLRYRKMMLG